MEEIMINHERSVRAVLRVLWKENLIVDPKKANMFMGEVEFCGHILREGRWSPAPRKLLSIQKWVFLRAVLHFRSYHLLFQLCPKLCGTGCPTYVETSS